MNIRNNFTLPIKSPYQSHLHTPCGSLSITYIMKIGCDQHMCTISLSRTHTRIQSHKHTHTHTHSKSIYRYMLTCHILPCAPAMPVCARAFSNFSCVTCRIDADLGWGSSFVKSDIESQQAT